VDEIFSDGDVLQVFELHDDGVVPKLDLLDPLDRALIATFFDADQNPDKLTQLACLMPAPSASKFSKACPITPRQDGRNSSCTLLPLTLRRCGTDSKSTVSSLTRQLSLPTGSYLR